MVPSHSELDKATLSDSEATPNKDIHGKALLWIVFPLLALGILFGSRFVSQELPVFRDAGHFYYPQLKYEHEQWLQGQVPLWNPQDELGRPFAADGSTSLFYPGKLLFFLPFAFPTCLLLYVTVHLLLAAYNTFRLARDLNASMTAGTIAAVSYTFGGAVLSQQANLIFLVSASWLPLALLHGFNMIRGRSVRPNGILLAVVLSLFILGGDPQMVVHLMLVLFILWITLPHRQTAELSSDQSRISLKCLIRSYFGIAMLVAGLAAIQIFPTLQWSQRSERSMRTSSHTVGQWFQDSLRKEHYPSHILTRQPVADHQQQIYKFSLAPWQLAEVAYPNVTGRLYPHRQRWTFLINDNPAIWFPTIYQGIIPLLLGLFGLTFRRRKDAINAVLSWGLLFTISAALGYFGIGWLWGRVSAETNLASPAFGTYWWITNMIPQYVEFRYPAKWFILSSLLLALLASRGWDQLVQTSYLRSRKFRRLLLSACGVFILSLIAFIPFWNFLKAQLRVAFADRFLGPVSLDGIQYDLFSAPLQSLLVLLIFGSCLLWRTSRKRISIALPCLILVDILVANHWVIATAPARHWDSPSVIEQVTDPTSTSPPIRVYRARTKQWWPSSFSTTSSPHRLADALRWDRQSLRSRLHLLTPFQLLDTTASIANADYESLLRVMRKHGQIRPDRVTEPDLAGLALLGGEYFVGPVGFDPRDPDFSREHPPQLFLENAQWFRLQPPAPPAWITHDWETHPPITTHDPMKLDKLTEEIFYPAGTLRDFSRWSFLESTQSHPATAPSAHPPSVKIVRFSPGYLQVELEPAATGLLIINQGYAPGWYARIWNADNTLPQTRTVLRANRVMQGVLIEPGSQVIEFIYQPRSFLLGLIISGLVWSALVLLGLHQTIKYRRMNPV